MEGNISMGDMGGQVDMGGHVDGGLCGAMKKIKEYLKLMRFQAIGAVWIVLVVGSLAQGGRAVGWMHLMEMFLVAAFTYILAIVMNEYFDIEFDRVSHALSTKPLVAGTISRVRAMEIFWISGIVASLLVWFFWGIIPLVWFLFSVVVGAQYNIHGKKHFWMDIFVAVWAAMYCIFGAMTVKPGVLPWNLSPLVYVFSAMWFFRLVVGNSVEGGLKDLHHDIKAGAKTLPIWFGVSLEGDKIVYNIGWWLFELGLELGFALSILLPIYFGVLSYSPLQISIIIFFLIGMAITLSHISPPRFDREDIKKHTFLHEAMGFGIMGVMLLERAGWERALLILIVPLLWFGVWTRIIYGRRLPAI